MKDELQKGVKTRACDFIPLYNNLSGRIEPLHNRARETLISILEVQGQSRESLRKIVIVPDYPLMKVTKSDLIILPWGARPNTWVPPTAPLGFGPFIWVEAPDDTLYLLKWDGSKFASEFLNFLYSVESGWHFSGLTDDQLTDCDIRCLGKVTQSGYSIVKVGGPNAYFEVLKMDEHQDHLGRVSHYTFFVDWLDQKNVIIQE